MRRNAKILILLISIVVSASGLTLVVPSLRILPFSIYLLFQEDPSKLLIPVEGVSSSQLRDSWGAPRSGGRHHKGIDIFAKRGEAVRSTTKGLVVSVREDRLGGHTVWVLGPRDKWHYYAHLERYGDVRKGQWIQPGHFLGTVGDSGNARETPTHLHYAIYSPIGVAINPYAFLHSNDTVKRSTRLTKQPKYRHTVERNIFHTI